MAMPLGGNAKLAIDVETDYGSPIAAGNNAGLRIFYDSFTAEARKEPEDVEEISGVSIDRSEFVEGAVIVGGNLTYRVRYFGGHAVLFGLAMGDLSTAVDGDGFLHTVSLADDLESATVHHQIPVIISAATAQRDNTFAGMKVARSTWSHRSGGSLMHSLDFIGSYVDYDTSPATLPSSATPSLSGGRYPVENYVHWSHEDATTKFQLRRDSGTTTTVNVHSWELTLDNALVRQFRIQTGRKTAEPPRDGFREVTLRMEIEQDDAWQEFMRAYGYLNTNETEDFYVTWQMTDTTPAVYDHTLLFEVSNCRTTDVPRGITSPRSVRQTVEMRAHYQAASTYLNADPLSIVMGNEEDGPDVGTHADNYGDFL